MMSIWRTAVKALALFVLVGCQVAQPPERIALLAPFEGRYREVGYSALYPARLAITETAYELLAVDDGGSLETATARARALADDPNVKAVIAIGYDAAQVDYGDLPVVVVGYWGTSNGFMLTSNDIPARLSEPGRLEVTAAVESPLTGGEVFGLAGFRQLHDDFDGLRMVTSGRLPDDTFRQRVLESDPFATEPNHLAMLTYDAVHLAAAAIGESHEATIRNLATIRHEGISGDIRFGDDGYWMEAPVNTFTFSSDGQLIPANDIVEQR